jgi:hypothetical protein
MTPLTLTDPRPGNCADAIDVNARMDANAAKTNVLTIKLPAVVSECI